MKRPNLVSLLAVAALTSCSTMHDAAVTTFRVVDAPNVYLRRKLGVDEQQQLPAPPAQTTSSNRAAYPPPQPYPAQPPPVQTQRQVATQERQPERPVENVPAAGPPVAPKERTASTHRTAPKPSATPRAASTQQSDLPYGKPVPGKPGYVFSPFDKSGGYVDVTGYAPGQKVKDPYTGKIFLVP
ncbi:MAG: hypothetical protein ACREIF_14900 [Chthoniobacterales bacterium]